MQEVLGGRIRVPKFQRGLRWDAGDVEQLLDSIYRGYPIGTLLFWVREANAQRIEYGTVTVDAPGMSEAWWVIDGQQRLHALVRSLAGERFPQEAFALYFNLREQKFVRPRSHEQLEHWLPLTEVVDSERLMNWILEHPTVDRALAISVGKRIREYAIPVYFITTEDEYAVRESFARLNSTGKRMRDSEIFSALHGPGQGTPSHVREVAASLRELGFGTLDSELLHSMMLATRSVEISKNRVPEWTTEEVHAALADLERAGGSAIQFLRETAKIPHIVLLPYTLPLIALTRFFSLFPQVHPRNRELLSRWLWRGAMWGEHQGNTTSVRGALEAIHPGDEHQSVQRLLAMVNRWGMGHRIFKDGGFRFSDADGKLQALALWSLCPRHLVDGSFIHIEGEGEALFPPARITTKLDDGLLANRMIHPPLGSRTLRRAILAVEDEDVLASHAISRAMLEELRNGHYPAFANLRAERLDEIVQGLIELRARCMGASDRPPLEALIISDEEAEHGH